MSDDFSTRYRLLKCVLVEDGIRTHNAQQVATGKVVMVHINDAAGPGEVDALRADLALLQPDNQHKVLETATLPSGFAVVTEFLPGLVSFGSWLGRPKAAAVATSEGAMGVPVGDANQGLGAGVTDSTESFAPEPEPVLVIRKPAIRVSFKRPPAADALTALPAAEMPVVAAPPVPVPAVAVGPVAIPSVAIPPIPGLAAAIPPVAVPSVAVPPVAVPAFPISPIASAPPAPSAPVSSLLVDLSTGAGAESFTGIFGAPVDPSSLGGVVEYVRSGQPAPSAVGFALHSEIQLKTASPVGEAGMPVRSTPPAAPPSPTPVATSAPVVAPGEFTMMFAPSTPAPVIPAVMPSVMPAATAPVMPPPVPAVTAPVMPDATATVMPAAKAPMMPPLMPAATSRMMPMMPPLMPPPVQPPIPLELPPRIAAATAPAVSAPPAPSSFGWDTPAVAAVPLSKAPPGEFTLLFGVPATAAPLPDQMRASPMKEAPPPAFSTLTPENQQESPPVEPMHRVMGSNPSYVAGINQLGQSPIGNNLGMGGYAGAGNYPPATQPSSNLNFGGAAYSGRPYQDMPEFAPAPATPAYPAAHASPLFAHERQLASEPNALPGILPPPIFSSGSATPLSALGGAAQQISANAGPSEYTQLIANGVAPVVPELKPAKSTLETAKSSRRRLPTGLIIVINAVLLIAVFLVFFVYRQQIPNRQMLTPAKPVMPYIPKAPSIPRN